MSERNEISGGLPSETPEATMLPRRRPRRWFLALLVVAALLPVGAMRLLDGKQTIFGKPGETIVGPNRVSWQIKGLPSVGKGVAQDDASALWLGAAQSIHAGFCSGVSQGKVISTAEAPEGLKQALGIYVVSCLPDNDGQVRKYWFKRAGNGVSPCADLDSCKKNT